MNLSRDDEVVDMIAIQPGYSVLTICEKGFGKRTDIDEYRLTRRGGKGVINIKTTERNGKVVAIKAVRDEDELMVITAKGIMLRTGMGQIREIGRATQGVRIIRPDAGDRVVAVAKIAKEDGPDNGPNGEDGDRADGDDAQQPATDVAEEATDTDTPPTSDAPDQQEPGQA
jgi:DNA gyrase subunit A